MARYIVTSEGPISVREINRPDLPDWTPEQGGPPLAPGHGLPWRPDLPPREEWPPLPPWLAPGVGLPIPPTPEHPTVPLPDDPGTPETGLPGVIWPPIRPEMPDLSGHTLALVRVYLSRHVNFLRWVIIDHAAVKEAWEKLKDSMPAGGVGGRPPQRPTPAE